MNFLQRIERRLGFQTLADFDDIALALDFAAHHSFRALEVNLGNPNYLQQLRSSRERARIRERSRKYRIALLIHSVDGLNYFLADRQHLMMNLRFMKKIMTDAAAAGVIHYTFHLGMDMRYAYAGNQAKYTWELYPEYFADNLCWLLQELRAASRDYERMTLGIENVGGFRFPWVLPILERSLGGRLGLSMDIGHINVYKSRVQETENDFFFRHRQWIKSAHIHDNDGKTDQHSVIGEGTIDFLPYFQMLAKLNAWCIFEVRPKEAALECRNRFWRDIAPRLAVAPD